MIVSGRVKKKKTMAEVVVALVVQRIADLLSQELTFLRDVKEDVESLQGVLRRIQSFLKDADCKQYQDERVRNWVAEIRGVAYDAEDVIESYILKIATRRVEGARGIPKKVSSIFTKVPRLHGIKSQIESIRNKIEAISASMQTFDIKLDAERAVPGSASEMQQRLRRSYPHDEDDVISFHAITRDIKAQLMIEAERRQVVSIVGMGGLGKTTLAKKIYNDINVKQRFDCCAWVFISQQYTPRDLLVRIWMDVASTTDKSKLEAIKEEKLFASTNMESMKEEQSLKSMLESMEEEDLVKKLYKVLEKKRYLVVLDDIWNTETWDCLKRAFPNGKKGSKILFTTRNKSLASYADPSITPMEPPFLTNNEAWELLSRKAFPVEQSCPRNLEILGREMVKKCGGLPLAVVVLGGILATKKSLNEWKTVQKNVNAQFAMLERKNQYGGVYGILAMSYHDLPYHLKPCFLYLSQFPEDWEFHKRTLIRMWIAEGFIAQSQDSANQTMEDVAEIYLEELVSRCMVQVTERDHTGIHVKIFRIHSLMRDICISKAGDEHFAGGIEHRDEFATNTKSRFLKSATSQPRRIAVHPRIDGDNAGKRFYVPLVKCGDPHLRSLHYFVDQGKYRMTKGQEIYILSHFRLLRILNLENIYLSKYHVPGDIGNLIHLRYLGLRNTGLWVTTKYLFVVSTSLPASIGNLKSLYTLDVRNNSLESLPDVLWKLENLRHLLVEPEVDGQLRLDTLTHLETLKWVRAKNLIANNALCKLTNVRNLGIYFKETQEVDVVLKSRIFEQGRLSSLKMSISEEGSFQNLESLSRCDHLTKLELQGKILEDPEESLHHNLKFLPESLTKLTLCRSLLKQDPMCILGNKLHNLRFLVLHKLSYEGSKLSVNGFPRLEILTIEELELEEWQIEEGAMPCLRTLKIKALKKLRMIPEGFNFLVSLQELKIIDMAAFAKRIQVIDGVEGEDFDKVQHIPSMSFDYSWGCKVDELETDSEDSMEE